MNKLSYFVGVFGFLQISMRDVKLLDDKGKVIKKKHTLGEQDALAIYNWVGEQIKHVSQQELKVLARETDKRVSKLISDHSVVNNFLLSLMLLREYVDDQGSKMEEILLSTKINRLIEVVDGAVSDEEFDADIKRTTSRTARNIYRQFIGKEQLPDDGFNKFRRV